MQRFLCVYVFFPCLPAFKLAEWQNSSAIPDCKGRKAEGHTTCDDVELTEGESCSDYYSKVDSGNYLQCGPDGRNGCLHNGGECKSSCTIQDPIVYSEPGISGVGWSDTKVYRGYRQHNDKLMHGPYGYETTQVTRTFPLEGSGSCKVKWTMYGMHSRDNKYDSVWINGKEVWKHRMRGGYEKGGEKTVTCKDSLELTFKSEIDQDFSDEAWGFANVVITKDGKTVYSEISNPSTDGWSDTKVAKGYRQFTRYKMHGPWGRDVKQVIKEFKLDPSAEECSVGWTSYGMHSRDNKYDRVSINDQEVWKMRMRGNRVYSPIWSGPCAGSLKMKFTSEIDQAYNDEAWGFGNVVVHQQKKSVTAYSEPGISGVGWSDTKVYRGYRQHNDKLMHGPYGYETTQVTRTFPLVGSGSCKVKWTMYGMHSRDNKYDSVWINSKEVWKHRMRRGYEKGGEKTVTCKDSLELTFKSEIDQDFSDEAWGFANVVITKDGKTVYSEISNPSTDGWSDTKVAKGYRQFTRYKMHGPWGRDVK
eukprot:CAMPEP_0197703242 /NCGR_PEP_ID=MMETSP1338-20131121/125337_1 /TAXON_ID=43686 ORGANISM="Pelagodinium beii, Strain RCC1491" /NCGR_SAMPLE_ID=MMETSP1338 /ASSEMBLY_ACC=CAM_ASM_000754 /LENGTH=529 /DNA_ID=CAMNT_0043287135 /DNA_START=80 /DNA_END=1666 /DNA_ORIENTATION=-